MVRSGVAMALGLALSACGGAGMDGNAVDNAAANAAANLITATDNVAAGGPAPGVLDVWAGKHPSEKIDGVTFLGQPSVKAAVIAVVPSGKVRDFVFGYNGPDAPIVKKDGRLLAWGCEAHNCGYHNWSIAITPDGSNAEVCFYQDDAKADGPSTWYVAGGKTEQRPGNCPSQ
ncbi:MAG: hypothetical protein P0Y59_04155 [Candidatus Sphingomonas phytovorans]|nr:hypothetical protein [Sphingomonas sp.]WEK00895.1 MAG: hypothetical protein P0Y59_04155 [Sphingomonas sp.]